MLTTKIPKFEKDYEPEEEIVNESLFAGGREETVKAQLVPSNYCDKYSDELLLKIDGAVSLGTLMDIVEWAKENSDCSVGQGYDQVLLRK